MVTRSQSEWRDKYAGRRQTNFRRHRKGNPTGMAGRVGSFREDDPSLYGGSPMRAMKKMGTSNRSTDGVKDGGMRGKLTKGNRGVLP